MAAEQAGGGEIVTLTEPSSQPCRQCHRPIRNPVPEKWAQQYPDLKGLCRDCAFTWIVEHMPEDRPQQQTAPAEGAGWLDGVKEAGRS